MATKKEKPVTADVPQAETSPAGIQKTEKPAKAQVKKPAVKASVKQDVVELKAKESLPEKKAEMPKAKAEKLPVPAPEPVIADESSQPSAGLDRGALFFGAGLLAMGVLLLLGRLLQIPFGTFIWPFIFIVPGVLVFLTALSSESSSGEGLSILGGILTTLGMLFLVQSVTDLWASWAYAWALIAPASVGFSQIIYGERKGREAIVQSGRRLASIGMTIFIIGFIFFELILGISGYGLSRLGLPVFPMMLIFAGLVVLVRSYLRSRK